MKFLLHQLETLAPHFEKGGKFEKLYPIFEAGDTFLFSPSDTTKGSTHVRDAIDLKRVMIMVVVALIPCTLFGIWNAGQQYMVVNQIQAAMPSFVPFTLGSGPTQFIFAMFHGALIVLPIIFVSYAVGGLWEVLFCVVRKHEINEGFLVTGLLFPLTLPPTIPLWQVAVGISFGVVIGKEIFGGTGFNVLNPALTARAFLFFAYPVQISGDVWTKLVDGGQQLAGWSSATPLSVASASLPGGADTVLNDLNNAGYTFASMFNGVEGGSIGETAVIPILIGLFILLLTGLASWRIIIGGCIGVIATGLLLNGVGLMDDGFKAFCHLPFWYHFVMGSFLFGIVFMATDPVSAAATTQGKWIYGFLIGFLTVIIRVANPAYAEGVMLSILFMNVMAPLIDWFVVERHIKRRNAKIGEFSYAN